MVWELERHTELTFSSSCFCFLFSSTAALLCSSFLRWSSSFRCLSSICFSTWSLALRSLSRIWDPRTAALTTQNMGIREHCQDLSAHCNIRYFSVTKKKRKLNIWLTLLLFLLLSPFFGYSEFVINSKCCSVNHYREDKTYFILINLL